MSLIKGKEVYVFSAMEGTITYQGKPAGGAKIVRTVRWKDKKGESDSAIVSEDGKFSLPTMKRTLRQLFPAQFVAHQSIHVLFEGKDYHIWEMGKSDESDNGELGIKDLSIRCELTDELVPYPSALGGLLATSCKWDSM